MTRKEVKEISELNDSRNLGSDPTDPMFLHTEDPIDPEKPLFPETILKKPETKLDRIRAWLNDNFELSGDRRQSRSTLYAKDAYAILDEEV